MSNIRLLSILKNNIISELEIRILVLLSMIRCELYMSLCIYKLIKCNVIQHTRNTKKQQRKTTDCLRLARRQTSQERVKAQPPTLHFLTSIHPLRIIYNKTVQERTVPP